MDRENRIAALPPSGTGVLLPPPPPTSATPNFTSILNPPLV